MSDRHKSLIVKYGVKIMWKLPRIFILPIRSTFRHACISIKNTGRLQVIQLGWNIIPTDLCLSLPDFHYVPCTVSVRLKGHQTIGFGWRVMVAHFDLECIPIKLHLFQRRRMTEGHNGIKRNWHIFINILSSMLFEKHRFRLIRRSSTLFVLQNLTHILSSEGVVEFLYARSARL